MSEPTTIRTPDLDGEVDLMLPADLFDVVLPDDDDEAALAAFRDIFARLFPRLGEADRDTLARGLLAWRASLWGAGIVLHGIVGIPEDQPVEGIDGPVSWHLLAGVVDVPVGREIDPGAVAARYFGHELAGKAYTEAFATEMGWGVGLVTDVPFGTTTLGQPPGEVRLPGATSELPDSLGLAAAISAPVDGSKGLLVAGLCLDLDQVVEVGTLVAAIAGWSVIRLTGDDEDHGSHR